MGELVLVLVLSVALLAVGLVAIYLRLSPLQGLQDERTALFGALSGRRKAEADEGTGLLSKLRTLIKDQEGLLRHERSTTEKLRAYLGEERTASQAFCAQVNAARFAAEALCARLNEERSASEALRDELEVQRLALLDAFFGATSPEQVERAAQALTTSRALRAAYDKWARPQTENPAALVCDEETKREGVSSFPATSADPRAAHARQERERSTSLPQTPEDFAAQRQLVAATAADDRDVDSDDNETTRAWSSAALAQSLEANAGDAEAEDDEATRLLSQAAIAAALEAEAGGATRLPQTAPRALRAEALAPPASASLPLSSEPAMKAAGLGKRPTSTHGAPPSVSPRRTSTLVGLSTMLPPALPETALDERTSGPTLKQGGMGHSTHTPADTAPRSPVTHVAKTLLSMPAQSAKPTSSDAVTSLPGRREERDTIETPPPIAINEPAKTKAPEPPMYAPRRAANAEASRGQEGGSEAAPRRRLDPNEETPRRARGVEHEAGK